MRTNATDNQFTPEGLRERSPVRLENSRGIDGSGARSGGHERLERAMLVLEALAERPLRAKELADAICLNWTTTHRMLAFLREGGYVERDEETGMHYIGLRLYYIGSSYVANLPVLQAARPYLVAAAEATDGCVRLVEINGGRYASILITVEPRTQRMSPSVSSHVALHTGAAGLVLLAHAPTPFLESYVSALPTSAPPDIDATSLRERLDSIRHEGFAVSSGEGYPPTVEVGAPVRNAAGMVIACVRIENAADGFDSIRDHVVDTTLRTASVISEAMGWHA